MSAESIKESIQSTVATRMAIGFADDRSSWCQAPASFTDDQLRIAGHPVMERWEDGYMAALASIAARSGGRVLEVGYGLGISSQYLRRNKAVSEYWVIECHPDVLARATRDMSEDLASGRAHIISGFWEDVIPVLGDNTFDGILFDTYPLKEDEIHGNHFPFFPHARRLLSKKGSFTYYSDEVEHLSTRHVDLLQSAGFTSIDWMTIDVSPPSDCEYWTHNTIVAPIIRL